MIDQKYKLEIFDIFNKYEELRESLNNLEKFTEFLKTRQAETHSELVNTRNRENDLINKIEKETGKKLTPNDLLEIIQNYEK